MHKGDTLVIVYATSPERARATLAAHYPRIEDTPESTGVVSVAPSTV